jgi:predicted nucleic acid-binding protein
MLISNSSTLILLAKTNLLQKFLDNFKVTISDKVFGEITQNKELFDAKLIQKEVNIERVKVKKVESKKLKNVLEQFKLHEGEASAYVLFKGERGRAILTDDKELIKLCQIERVPFICALAIVVRMFEKGLLTKEEAKEKLDKINDYGRYSKDVYEYFKSKVK